LLENPLTEVAGEEEAVWTTRSERGEKLQLRHADVLGCVDHGKVERQERLTSRYASQVSNCHASTTSSHSVSKKCWLNF